MPRLASVTPARLNLLKCSSHAMDGEPFTLASVPSIGRRLYASFGLGNEMHIVDLADGSTESSSTATMVQW